MIRYLLLTLLFISTAANSAGLNIAVDCKGQLPDGKYLAKSDQGVLIIEGTYQLGNKHGVFTFYNSTGKKIIEIPYTQDKLNGTVRAWYYLEDSKQSKTLKLISVISNGYIEGKYQTWYPSGAKRSNFVIEEGDIQTGEVWNEDGSAIDIKAKANFLQNDIDSDFNYYGQLEQVLETYPPSC